MNLPLVSYKGKAEKREKIHRCLHCKREFSSYRALGGHCRVHRREIKSRSHNYPWLSGNLVAIASTNFYPIVCSLPENTTGGARKLLPLFDIETYPRGFSKTFCLCVTAMGNPFKLFGCNLANTNSQFFTSSNLLTPGQSCEIQPPTWSSATVPISSNMGETISLNAFSCHAAIGFPFNPSLSFGTNKALQFSAIDFTCRDGTPFSGKTFTNIMLYDLNKLPFPSAPADAYLVLGPVQLHGIKESTIGSDSFPGGPYQYPVQENIGQSNKRSLAGLEGNMRSDLVAVPFAGNEMNASKRLKTDSCLSVQTNKPRRKELRLFKYERCSFLNPRPSIDAEMEVPGDLDLSLHL